MFFNEYKINSPNVFKMRMIKIESRTFEMQYKYSSHHMSRQLKSWGIMATFVIGLSAGVHSPVSRTCWWSCGHTPDNALDSSGRAPPFLSEPRANLCTRLLHNTSTVGGQQYIKFQILLCTLENIFKMLNMITTSQRVPQLGWYSRRFSVQCCCLCCRAQDHLSGPALHSHWPVNSRRKSSVIVNHKSHLDCTNISARPLKL